MRKRLSHIGGMKYCITSRVPLNAIRPQYSFIPDQGRTDSGDLFGRETAIWDATNTGVKVVTSPTPETMQAVSC